MWGAKTVIGWVLVCHRLLTGGCQIYMECCLCFTGCGAVSGHSVVSLLPSASHIHRSYTQPQTYFKVKCQSTSVGYCRHGLCGICSSVALDDKKTPEAWCRYITLMKNSHIWIVHKFYFMTIKIYSRRWSANCIRGNDVKTQGQIHK